MGATIKPDLYEHIDGLINTYSEKNTNRKTEDKEPATCK